MRSELFEHAARVLEHAPSRSMTADLLCERLRTEAGLKVGVYVLLEALRAAPDRFAVLQPPLCLGGQNGWRVAEKLVYERALGDAHMGLPIVTLAGTTPDSAAQALEPPLEPAPVQGPGALLADAHEAIAALLAANPDDAEFGIELAGAVAQLEEARRVLEVRP